MTDASNTQNECPEDIKKIVRASRAKIGYLLKSSSHDPLTLEEQREILRRLFLNSWNR